MPSVKVVPYNFEMHSGDDKLITITVLDQDDVAVPLTGASISMVIAQRAGSAPIVTKAGTITDDLNGIFEVQLDAADTDSLAGVYHWEAQVTDVNTRKATVAYGSIEIKEDSAP